MLKKFYILWSVNHVSTGNGIRNNKTDYTSREEQIGVKNKLNKNDRNSSTAKFGG